MPPIVPPLSVSEESETGTVPAKVTFPPLTTSETGPVCVPITTFPPLTTIETADRMLRMPPLVLPAEPSLVKAGVLI